MSTSTGQFFKAKGKPGPRRRKRPGTRPQNLAKCWDPKRTQSCKIILPSSRAPKSLASIPEQTQYLNLSQDEGVGLFEPTLVPEKELDDKESDQDRAESLENLLLQERSNLDSKECSRLHQAFDAFESIEVTLCKYRKPSRKKLSITDGSLIGQDKTRVSSELIVAPTQAGMLEGWIEIENLSRENITYCIIGSTPRKFSIEPKMSWIPPLTSTKVRVSTEEHYANIVDDNFAVYAIPVYFKEQLRRVKLELLWKVFGSKLLPVDTVEKQMVKTIFPNAGFSAVRELTIMELMCIQQIGKPWSRPGPVQDFPVDPDTEAMFLSYWGLNEKSEGVKAKYIAREEQRRKQVNRRKAKQRIFITRQLFSNIAFFWSTMWFLGQVIDPKNPRPFQSLEDTYFASYGWFGKIQEEMTDIHKYFSDMILGW